MTLSDQDLLNLKNAQNLINALQNAENGMPLLYNTQQHAVENFKMINKRDINFNSINDLNQAEYLYNIEKIIRNEKDLGFLKTASASHLKAIISTFKISSKEDDSSELKGYINKLWNSDIMGRIKNLDIVKFIVDAITPDKAYFTDRIVNNIEQREDAADILQYMAKTLDKDRFTKEGFDELQIRISLSTNDKLQGLYKKVADLKGEISKNEKISTLASEELNLLNKKIDELTKVVAQHQQDLADKDLEKAQASFKNIIQEMKGIASNLHTIGAYSGNKDFTKVASIIDSAANIANSFSAFSAAAGSASIVPGLGIVTGVMAIFSVLAADDDNGFAEFAQQVMEALGKIIEELRTMRKEMHERFDHTDKMVMAVYDLLYKHHLYVGQKLNQLKTIGEFTVNEISGLVKADVFLKTIEIIRNIETKTLPDGAAQLKQDLKHLDTIAFSLAKLDSFNGANLKSDSLYSHATQTQLSLRENVVDNIGFYVNYAKNVHKVEGLKAGAEVPNFNVFYKAAQAFINLVIQASSKDQMAKAEDKLINKANSEFIVKCLNDISQMNAEIIATVEALKKADIVGKVLGQYKYQVNELFQYIHSEMVKFSLKQKLSGIDGDFNIFSPDYNKIKEYEKSYSVSDYCVHRFNIPFAQDHIEKFVKIAKGGNGHPKIPKSAQAFVCKKILERKFKHHETEIDTKVNDKLKSLRVDFFKALKLDQGYKDHLEKLTVLENLTKTYAILLGDKIEVNFFKPIEDQLTAMEKFASSDHNALSVNSYKVSIDKNTALTDAHLKWSKSTKNHYKDIGDPFKQQIDFAKNFVELLIKIEEAQEATKAHPQEESTSKESPEEFVQKAKANPSPESSTKKNTVQEDEVKLKKAYLQLKNLFQEILDQQEEISEALKAKPEKFEKFTQLLENVHIEETGLIDPVPEGFTLADLKLRQCEMYCLDKHLQRHDEGYRASMKNDHTMNYVIDTLHALSGEIEICYC